MLRERLGEGRRLDEEGEGVDEEGMKEPWWKLTVGFH